MAKPPNGATGEVNGAKSEEAEAEADARWGTWEELLLACAVNRYGTNCWDSVAVEIQKRSSSTTPPLLLTPRNCQKKYLDLTRRFFLKNDRRNDNNNGVNSKNDDVQAADDDGSIITTDESVPLLEELRKLRVAELRRDLERYDLSIVALQSKVKKMKEERERSEIRDEKSSDPLSERDSGEVNREDIKDEPEKLPSSVAGEVAVSPVIGKDEQSVNDSSTDRRSEDIGTGRNEEEKMEESGRAGDRNVEPVRTEEDKPVKEEDSCYGSSDSVEKEDPEPEPDPKPVPNEVKVEPESVSDSPELVESVAESKDGGGGGEDATNKECSDVQSSATQSRREAGTDKVLRGSCNDNDHKNKSRSQTVKLEPSVESQPFIDFLENVKGHELGSLFLRRLDSQEAPNYKSLIRQHVDLEIVEKKVKEGIYSDSNLKFFRDLLLLVNNAMVFFSKNTPEFLAAMELRHLIATEMALGNAKLDSSSEKQASLEKEVSLPKKESSEPSEPLLRKPKLGGPLIVCRKRSSIAAKASASSSSASDKKRDQRTLPTEERAVLDVKQSPPQLPGKAEEPRITKKRSRDRFASVSTNLKKNTKNGTDTSSKQTSGTNLEKNKGKGGSSSQQLEPKCESKSSQSNVDLKKRSAAHFLNRMKQSTSSNNNTLLDALKSSPLTAANNSKGGSQFKKNENGKGSGGSEIKKNENGKGSGGSGHKKNETGKGSGGSENKKNDHGKGVGGFEHKKNENVKGSGKKEQVSARNSDAKQAKEKTSPAKITLGKPPPKKGAAAPTPSGKRGRDRRESESVASKHQRKRSRK